MAENRLPNRSLSNSFDSHYDSILDSSALRVKSEDIPFPSIFTSISPWYILTYPIQTIQSRVICARYLTRVQYVQFPHYLNPLSSRQTLYKDDGNLHVYPSEPLLLSVTTSTGANIFRLLAVAIKTVYYNEGLPGLFRGFVPLATHRYLSDILAWGIRRYAFYSCIVASRGIVRLFDFMVYPIVWSSRTIRNCFISRPAIETDVQIEPSNENLHYIGSLEDMTRGNQIKQSMTECTLDSVSLGPIDISSLNPSPSLREDFINVVLPPIVLKYSVELCLYPLLVVGSRMCVLETPGMTDMSTNWSSSLLNLIENASLMGVLELMYMTYTLDGWTGFWGGLIPHVISKSADDIINVFMYLKNAISVKFSPNKSSRRELASNNNMYLSNYIKTNEESHFNITNDPKDAKYDSVDDRLRQLEGYILHAWLSAILNIAVAPLSQLSTIQRCQSKISGLCEHTDWINILSAIPRKPLLLQLAICVLFLGANSLVVTMSQERLKRIEESDSRASR